MSYPINKNINPYQQTSMGVNNNPQLQLQNLNVNPDDVAQNVAQNSMLKGVKDDDENSMFSPKTFLISLPVWLAMVFGMDKFNAACGGDYNKGLLGKVGEFGDKITKKAPFLETFFTKAAAAKEKFMTKFVVPKHKILYAFFKTPAEPVNKGAMTPYKGTSAEIASNAVTTLRTHMDGGGKLFLDGKEFTAEDLKLLEENSYTKESIEKIIKICSQQPEGAEALVKIERAGKIPLIDFFTKKPVYLTDILQFTKKFMLRPTRFSEFANKLSAFKPETLTQTSRLGKFLPKAMIRTIEGITNGTAGGKIAVLMGAYFVADAIRKTMKAPKGNGEKRKTFAENMIYNLGWYLTMPFGLGIMYKSGGFKYLGMTADKLKEYREELAKFNNAVEAGQYNTKEAYNAAKKTLKTTLKGLLKGDIGIAEKDAAGTKALKVLKNVVYQPLKLAGKVLTVGLDTIKPFNPKGLAKESSIIDKLAHTFMYGKASTLQRGAGFVLRFGLFMFAISPFLGKLCAKGSHIIFGKPTKSVLDEDKEPEKVKPPLIIPKQDASNQAQTQMQQPVSNQQQGSEMKPLQRNQANNQMIPENRENLAANSNKKTNEIAVPSQDDTVRRYIPSTDPVIINRKSNPEKYAKADKSINDYDKKEKKAQQTLKK